MLSMRMNRNIADHPDPLQAAGVDAARSSADPYRRRFHFVARIDMGRYLNQRHLSV
jgi:hypothetical protein